MADNNPNCTCPYNRAGDDPHCPTHGMLDLIDPEAPYPEGCGPDCKGCDPCVCGQPWSEHTELGMGCAKFDSRFKPHIVMPSKVTNPT